MFGVLLWDCVSVIPICFLSFVTLLRLVRVLTPKGREGRT